MSAPTSILTERRATFLPGEQLRYVCGLGASCPYRTSWWLDEGGAALEMRGHIETDHPEWLPYGPCADCGRRTDNYRAVAVGIGTVWLCEEHGPKPDVIYDNAE